MKRKFLNFLGANADADDLSVGGLVIVLTAPFEVVTHGPQDDAPVSSALSHEMKAIPTDEFELMWVCELCGCENPEVLVKCSSCPNFNPFVRTSV